MSTALKILRSSAVLGVAEVVNNACVFLRNLILARALKVEDFGIAATLALVISLFELSGKLAFGQQVVRAPSEDPQFQDNAHGFQALAGFLSAALILACASPLAYIFKIESHVATLAFLAFIPLFNGFGSLDVYRMTRHHRFTPLLLSETVPQVITTLAAWPCATLFADHRAVLLILLAKAFFSWVSSHVFAERRYRLKLSYPFIRESMQFAWPLLASNFLMFGILQGDRMLIAGAYSMADLGLYAAASTLAMAPTIAIFKISGTVGLPILAKEQHNPERFLSRYICFSEILALSSTLMCVFTVSAGDWFLRLCFGRKYDGAAEFLAWLIVGQAFRLLRGASTCAAMAKGDTINTLNSNLWRISALVIALPIVVMKWDIIWIAAAATVGELLALLASVVGLRRRHGIPYGGTIGPLMILLLFTAGVFALRISLPGNSLLNSLFVGLAGCVFACVVFLALFSHLRKVLSDLVAALRGRYGFWFASRGVHGRTLIP